MIDSDDALYSDSPSDDDLLTDLTLDRLIQMLDHRDQLVIRAHLAGIEPHDLGLGISEYDSYIVPQIIHRLAVLSGVKRPCTKCGRLLTADHFGWRASDDQCRSCEPPDRSYKRGQYELWQRRVHRGEQIECEGCGPRPAEDFRPDRPRCRECAAAQSRADGSTHQRVRRLTDDQVREIRARHTAGETPTALALEFGKSPSTIRSIIRRRIYRDVL